MHEFFSSNLGLVTDRQTDRQKAMHNTPPCISTGGLKNGAGAVTECVYMTKIVWVLPIDNVSNFVKQTYSLIKMSYNLPAPPAQSC